MLHILLLILKITGIILAVILGILVLLVCIVVFVPVRYEANGKCSGKIQTLKVKGKVTWMFSLVRADIYYKENKLKWRLRIAWKKFLGGQEYGTGLSSEELPPQDAGVQNKRTEGEEYEETWEETEGYEEGGKETWRYEPEESKESNEEIWWDEFGEGEKDEEDEKIYQEILALNPYNLELFEQMLAVFGDENGELGTLADYYGVALQDSKDRQALQYVKGIQGEMEEDSVKAKEKLIEYCGTLSLPVTDELDCMKYINQRLEDFDLQYRTVDGVVCTTRDSADFAREELQALQAFFSEIAPPTSESLLDYEAELLEKRTEFEERFSSELKQKYLDKINGYLADFDKKFCTTGLLKKVDRKQAGKDRLLKAMKKADTSSLEKIEEARRSIEELLPKLGLVQEDTAEAVQYLEKQKDKILNPKSGMDMIKGLGKLFKK